MTTSHPEYLALLAAVCREANLADDTPRLVLADWLDENDGAAACVRCNGGGWAEPRPTGREIHETIGADGSITRWRNPEPFEPLKLPPPCPTCGGTGSTPNRFAERAALIRGQVRGDIPEAEFTVWSDNWRSPWWVAATGGRWGNSPYATPGHVRTWYDVMRDVMGPTWWAVHRTNHRVVFRRGFPAEVRLTLSLWLDLGPGLVTRFPVDAVRPTDFPATEPQPGKWHAVVETDDHLWGKNRWFDTEEKALKEQSDGLLRLARHAAEEERA